jgi:hypothetical protein
MMHAETLFSLIIDECGVRVPCATYSETVNGGFVKSIIILFKTNGNLKTNGELYS